MTKRREFLAMSAAAASYLIAPATTYAQSSLPKGPITLVVPFAAGGATDVVSRLLAKKVTDKTGVSIVVDNVAGGGGVVGAAKVVRSNKDGSVLLMGTVSTHAINPLARATPPYDCLKDFTPISLVATVPNVILVNNSVKAQNLKELIAMLKADPNKYSYGTSGVGTPPHLSGELFKTMAGVEMAHVPYRGGGPAMTDLISGQIDFAVTTLATAAAMISSKRVKVLGVSSKERVPLVKDVATFGESQALKGVDMLVWAVLFAPPGTPDAVVQKMNQAIVQVNALPSMKALVLKLGSELPPSLTPAQTREYLKAQRELYQDAASRIQPE